MDMKRHASLAVPQALLQAVLRLLRPLARLLMSHGIGFPAFSEMVKGVFVDVAARDFHADAAPVTDSRVSLLSGVHRRDVKRLRAEFMGQAPVPASVSMGAQIVARWCADSRYLDNQRRPMPLPRLASRGGELSFESLVAGVSKDIRARAVLEEWQRLGVAYLDDEDRVHLSESAFVPAKGMDEKAFFFGKNIADHLAASTHNLLDGQPPFLDRCVYYDGLKPESVEALRTLTRELAISALQEVNRRALELQQQDADHPGADRRMTFGVYYYAEPMPGHSGGKEGRE